MNTNEIRHAFLAFFAEKHHEEVKSASLVPAGDPTLLFTNAGMVQFKDAFLGVEKRKTPRAVSSQKCLRISGKHNDLENVGRTKRHHTFFEMLGNFSFGDYFKEKAIEYAWEFLTDRLKLDKSRLWVTVFSGDEEDGLLADTDAEELWKKCTDIPHERILKCGKADNFWAMGETGPCGPCSEIHYYLGDDLKHTTEEEFRKDDGTFLEVWNLVFMQFNRDIKGGLSPLPAPSVDTGMGLERIASVVQSKDNNYETDLFKSLIDRVGALSQKRYGGTFTVSDDEISYKRDVAFRVVVDHARAVAFLIADGVPPGSEGRGYVVRRLIRRAVKHGGKELGFKQPFLFEVAQAVVELYGQHYPELLASKENISKQIKAEEARFLKTLDSGLVYLDKQLDKVDKRLSGEVAFKLHDTYGFPLDMTEDHLRDFGIKVDTHEFETLMEQQRERSRAARSSETALILQKSVKPNSTRFLGYDQLEAESEIVGLFTEDGEQKSAPSGAHVAVVVRETPFYAESGGQVGDTGSITASGVSLEVIDTQKAHGDTFVHICQVAEGEIVSGSKVHLSVDRNRREKIRSNHSATHLLHMALRDVLGAHVHQAGSRVSDTSLRFDFSHDKAISEAELRDIESIVNGSARENHAVRTHVDVPIEEAKKMGAIALFGEKYADKVRVIEIGPNSLEFCGGTHVGRSGDIGFVVLGSEGSVSAGTRRIEAFSGESAQRHLGQYQHIMHTLSGLLGASSEEMVARVERVLRAQRESEKELERLGAKLQSSKGGDLVDQAESLSSGAKLVAAKVDNASPKQLRELADDLKQRLGSACIALAAEKDGKAILLTAVTDDLTKSVHAGKLISAMGEVVGAKGGGRADMAQAGGGDAHAIPAALERFRELVR